MICAEEAVTEDMIFLVSVPFLSFWGMRSWHKAEGSRTEQLTHPWCLTTLASHHMARVSREECKGGKEEQCPFALLVPFLYLHMGRRFSIRSLSQVCRFSLGGLVLSPSMEEFRKCTPEKLCFHSQEKKRKKKKRKGKKENTTAPGRGGAGVTNLPTARPASAPPPGEEALPRSWGRGAGTRRLPCASPAAPPRLPVTVVGGNTASHRGVSAVPGRRGASRPMKLPVKPGLGGWDVPVSLPRFKLPKRRGEVKPRGAPGGCPVPCGLPRSRPLPPAGQRAPQPRPPLSSCRRGEAGRGGQDRSSRRFRVDFVPSGSGFQREAAIKRCPPAAAAPSRRQRQGPAAVVFVSYAFKCVIQTETNSFCK